MEKKAKTQTVVSQTHLIITFDDHGPGLRLISTLQPCSRAEGQQAIGKTRLHSGTHRMTL